MFTAAAARIHVARSVSLAWATARATQFGTGRSNTDEVSCIRRPKDEAAIAVFSYHWASLISKWEAPSKSHLEKEAFRDGNMGLLSLFLSP